MFQMIDQRDVNVLQTIEGQVELLQTMKGANIGESQTMDLIVGKNQLSKSIEKNR